MIWTVLSLLCLVVLGGFISYYGDLQGRRWGKRRVSWFGLRPKHTAILITSLTGSFVALLSVATLLVAAPTVREIVLRGETAIRDNKHLNTQLIRQSIEYGNAVQDKNNQLTLINASLQDKTAQLQEAQRNYERACQDRDKTEAELRPLKARRDQLEKEVRQKQRELRQTQAALQQARLDNSRAKSINADLGRQTMDYSRQNATWERQNKELASQNLALGTSNHDLENSNNSLKTVNLGLTAEHDRLLADNTNLRALNSARKTENDALYQSNQELTRTNQELARTKNELYRQLAGAGQSYTALRRSRFTLPAGAELARRTIDAHLRPEAVERQLQDLLRDAGATARRYRAVPGENRREVVFVPDRVVSLTGDEATDEEAGLKALAANLAGRDLPVVVRANAINNSVEGEQVMIDLAPAFVTRTVVFPKGAVVASRKVDAHQPIDRVMDAILQFLQHDVKDAAIKAGLIPRLDPDTGQEEVGSVGPTEMFKLTQRVLRMGGQLQLTAVARVPVTSADMLQVAGDKRDKQNLDVRITRVDGSL